MVKVRGFAVVKQRLFTYRTDAALHLYLPGSCLRKRDISRSQPIRMPIPKQMRNHAFIAVNHHLHVPRGGLPWAANPSRKLNFHLMGYHQGIQLGCIMTYLQYFLKALPSLNNPYALAGFLVMVLASILFILSKYKTLSRLSPGQTSSVVRLTIKYTFYLSVIVFVSVTAHAAFVAYIATRTKSVSKPVNQQAGDCSVVQNGNGNSATAKCENPPAGER